MTTTNPDQTIFLTLVRSRRERACARLLIDSLRSFGGSLSPCQIWLFEANPLEASCSELEGPGISVIPLDIPASVRSFIFGDKVYAGAHAESLAPVEVQSFVWIDPTVLVVQAPILFDLGASFDAAVRPVHIRNVGLLHNEPLDGYWQRIYETLGVQDIQTTVEAFVDGQKLRAYFNSHAFAINPSLGLLQRWFEHFEALVQDKAFQSAFCEDDRRQIFLFQAILSALLVSALPAERLHLLPPEYNYPYNLHASIPAERRAQALNDVVTLVYEGRSLDPRQMDDIQVKEPLRAWLAARV